jgi:hypothetical protein
MYKFLIVALSVLVAVQAFNYDNSGIANSAAARALEQLKSQQVFSGDLTVLTTKNVQVNGNYFRLTVDVLVRDENNRYTVII